MCFVGQLPFDVTSGELHRLFDSVGCTPVRIRLLTERGTTRSRGAAFVDLLPSPTVPKSLKGTVSTEPSAYPGVLQYRIDAALTLHRSMVHGRRINVELSVVGAGNTEKRKAAISNLKLQRDKERLAAVDDLLREASDGTGGVFQPSMIDAACKAYLAGLPLQAARSVLEEFVSKDVARMRNPVAYIMGIAKRFVHKGDDGGEEDE